MQTFFATDDLSVLGTATCLTSSPPKNPYILWSSLSFLLLPFRTEGCSITSLHRMPALPAAALLLAQTVVSLTFKMSNKNILVSPRIWATGGEPKQCRFRSSPLWGNSCKMQNCWSSASTFTLIKALSQRSFLMARLVLKITEEVFIWKNFINLQIIGKFIVDTLYSVLQKQSNEVKPPG